MFCQTVAELVVHVVVVAVVAAGPVAAKVPFVGLVVVPVV